MIVRERIENAAETLTIGERKLAAMILSDYPFSGLAPIHELARHSEVSAPSISRFVTKIGLEGYQEFQRELISELKQGMRSPLDLHAPGRPVEGGFLKDFIAKSTSQMAIAADAITEDQFLQICTLLADPKRRIYVIGGRISDTIAKHLTFHLQLSRKDVYHLPPNAEGWPEYLLRMRQGDILFLVDFRRYEPLLEQLASRAAQSRHARIILMTDKWISPIAKHAREVLPVPIDSGTLWDTYSAALAVTEAIVTRIAEHDWDKTRARMEAWEALRLRPKEDQT
ncbi:MurR/RpiR family transcriptional regulator [Roseovarius sp. LXJ103]|uniref:MurR/RpiR family transcriptional regulator n=1 Tax=Roseovarius carneus TaxID=2853164 RepID=UPI000D603F2B|nr:MurR/RpiR family transcriptional regulator [Roseovarius carneus]MBZ8118821.1 MurR/RpiR family transcriptional regulator [Roseovarius carneus]PWE35510.1 RpiR family transcriptional regulator [Pelagicola sp. LXJ1103]